MPPNEGLRRKTWAHALKYLTARPRSEMQLRGRLMLKEWADSNAVDWCVTRLKELGYIDDHKFALEYASSRLRAKPVGRTRIARELMTRQIDREVIELTLNEVFGEAGEEEVLERALSKRLRIYGVPRDRMELKRLFDHLVRLGFGRQLIVEKIRDLELRGTRAENEEE